MSNSVENTNTVEEQTTTEPRRSSRTPKPKVNYDSDESPPHARRRVEVGAIFTKTEQQKEEKRRIQEEKNRAQEEKCRAQEKKRAEMNAKKLERQHEKERLALDKKQQLVQKHEEKLKRDLEKAALKTKRDQECQLKRMEKEKIQEQKRIAKELKKKPKTLVESTSFTKFLEQHQTTTTNTPEDMTKLLELARKYHATRNGNAVLSGAKREKLTEAQLAAWKAHYTQSGKALSAPDIVHSKLLTAKTVPLKHEDATAQAQQALTIASAMFTSDSEDSFSEDILSVDESEIDLTRDDEVDLTTEENESINVQHSDSSPIIVEVPTLSSLYEDQEVEQLRREQEELEQLLAITKERAKLRKRNKELQEQLNQLKKPDEEQ